ncbi:MAG: hypothetical protein LBD85_03635 [Oscillospiraceae bacterium]|nr:hypothetical protein [Oscillospiraceae bacterium]
MTGINKRAASRIGETYPIDELRRLSPAENTEVYRGSETGNSNREDFERNVFLIFDNLRMRHIKIAAA